MRINDVASTFECNMMYSCISIARVRNGKFHIFPYSTFNILYRIYGSKQKQTYDKRNNMQIYHANCQHCNKYVFQRLGIRFSSYAYSILILGQANAFIYKKCSFFVSLKTTCIFIEFQKYF